MAEVLKIDPHSEDFRPLRPAVDVLARGGVLAGPTETFYALMASASRPEALERIVKLKGRDGNKPLLLLIDHPHRWPCYAREMPESARGLTAAFWPGPLTLLLRAKPGLPTALVGPTNTVGVRVVGLEAVRMLVRSLDRAVTGTSANPGGLPPSRTPDEVQDYFRDDIDLILDGGPCPGGEPSGLIDVSLVRPRLIRQGCLSMNQIMKAAPDLRA